MKRLTIVAAAALVLACLFGGASVSARLDTNAKSVGHTVKVKPASTAIKCVINPITFSHSYTVKATRTCKVGGKTVALAGKWSWTVQLGDYHGYMGGLSGFTPHGPGSSFTLPIVKLTGGHLPGFNPPGYVKAAFVFTATYRRKPIKAVASSPPWTDPDTHAIGVGVAPLVSKPGSGTPACGWLPTPTFVATTLKGGTERCINVGGKGKCTLVNTTPSVEGAYALLNPTEVHCPGADGQSYVSRIVIDVYSNPAVPATPGKYECWKEFVGISTFNIPAPWGGVIWPAENIDNRTNPTHFPPGSEWQMANGWSDPLSGSVDPCTTELK